jgi:D-alanyl-D-alanine carboxypeptidase
MGFCGPAGGSMVGYRQHGALRREVSVLAGLVAAGATLLLVASCSSDAGSTDRPTTAATASPSLVPGETTPSVPTTIGGFERIAQRWVDQASEPAPGAMVLVRVGNQVRVVTSGLADRRTKRPLAPNETFPIESITKSMVAAAVMQQVAAGRLGLDDTVDQWLPGLVVQGQQMTIRQLLSHRSGIHEPGARELPPFRTLTDRMIVRIAGAHRPDFKPGSQGAYSNTGYVVLGMILEKVTDAPLRKLLATQVFEPAEMSHTALAPTRWDVHGYHNGRDVTAVQWLNLVQAAGGIVSTVGDVDSFYQQLWAGDLVPLRLVRQMTQPSGTIPFDAGDYGLGIWIKQLSCGTAWGHQGLSSGYVTAAWTLPRLDRSVVVMLNRGDALDSLDGIVEGVLCP